MKQYFTGFFTAACLTASVFMLIGAESKNLGDIEVNSIKVVDKNDRITVHIGTNIMVVVGLEPTTQMVKKLPILGQVKVVLVFL